jgi:hypothetical protein
MSPVGYSGCVVKCPDLYTSAVIDGGIPACVMKDSAGNLFTSFRLTLAQGVPFGTPGVKPNTPHTDPGWRGVFDSAYKDYTRDLAVASATVSDSQKINTAFRTLQAAENARGTPGGESAYETARVAYYTLTQGDTWLEQEKTRIANTEAQPIVDNYVAQYNGIQEKKNQQQSTIDVVDGVRDKILTVKDDLKYSVSTFQKQIGNIKNQINKNKIEQSQSIAAASSWVDTFLNWVIALATLAAIILLVRRFYKGGAAPTIEELETKARLIRAQAMLKNANTGIPHNWWDW